MSNDYEKIKVLLIEDDPMVQEVNRQFIERTPNFQVVGVASNGQEGIKRLLELEVQLVVLDIYMPEKNGLETIQEIRTQNMDVDIIAITAARDTETIQQIFRFGAIDYIIKPFKYERLKHSLEKYWMLKHRMNQSDLTQEDIDHLRKYTQQPDDELPKGLHHYTLNQILQFLMERQDPLSAEEVAEGVGIARVTARRYLDYLEKIGRVNIDIKYGTIGRPINRYKLNGF
ncbi:response regulator [Microaerobacter geothermalis]|uniref:response regulator n=1 Tax=Microaerobacter geothermalis TaxID=674972 RepID=UPI001F1EF601|nr:response regulator [Microaerobacter geothermalis]MCF6092985.1 response regulator [Microaerobacter geothermalis]